MKLPKNNKTGVREKQKNPTVSDSLHESKWEESDVEGSVAKESPPKKPIKEPKKVVFPRQD